MVKIMYSEVTIYPEKIKIVYNRFLDEMRATLAEYFETLQERGILRKEMSPKMAARVFLWVLFSYFRAEEIMRPGGMKKRTLDKHMREIIDIFTRGTLKRAGGAKGRSV
jgi:hypothetical protein